jgi:Ser/Thr protein kinase RdoA (MazF antagonist)
LEPGWDSYEAAPPSETAILHARRLLEHLQEQEGLPPAQIAASAEGGVVVAFSRGPKYADIECFNDGEILAMISLPPEEPTVWSLEGLETGSLHATFERIAAFLNR